MKYAISTICLAILATLTLSMSPLPAMGQSVLSNDSLFERAKGAWENHNYIRTYGYIFSYIQRNPPQMQDNDFSRQMRGWLDAAYQNARAQAGSGSSTTAGTGDTNGNIGSTSQGLRVARAVEYDPPATTRTSHPRSYRLECRGGGDMSANYYPVSSTHRLEIHFDKASRAARDRAPGPGQCAWVDRPVNSEEPWWISWTFDASRQTIKRVMFGSDDGVSGLSLGPNPTQYTSGLIMEVRGGTLERLVEAVHRGRRFAVDCYNNRQGRFVVTRVDVN